MKLSPRLKYALVGFSAVIIAVVGGLWAEQSWKYAHANPTPVAPDNLVLHVDRGLKPEDLATLQAKIEAQKADIAADTAAGKPDITKVLFLGNLYYEVGDLENAALTYRSILKDHPKDTPSFENLAQVQIEEGDYAGAEQSLRAAVDISAYEPTYLKLVDLIDEHFPARRQEIKGLLETAIGNLGQTPGLLARLAKWYADQGKIDEAISHYEVAHQLDPQDATITQALLDLRAKKAAQPIE